VLGEDGVYFGLIDTDDPFVDIRIGQRCPIADVAASLYQRCRQCRTVGPQAVDDRGRLRPGVLFVIERAFQLIDLAPQCQFPPGPVVASGGAPLPTPPARAGEPIYPGNGGNAGNAAYPGDVDVPPARYMSNYGVLASATRPPYTTLTAYDLSTGEIKWQVPNGDHPPTIAAGGPAGTGGLGARNGLVATKGGLVFHAGGDGKFRAYDVDTGRVLWTGAFGGNAPGVPVSYESRGRQFVVVTAERGNGRDAARDDSAPTGLIAFALPRR
jgi:hypothetical protein